MAQIIRFSEIQTARQRGERQTRDRESLARGGGAQGKPCRRRRDAERCVGREQAELLERVERLATMVRYGLRMLGEIGEDGDRSPAPAPPH